MRFQEGNSINNDKAPYRVPFYPDMVGAHLLISRPAGGVLEHFLQELQ
jgi:hypothetical protein